jgi:hypothetical protein
MKAVSESTRNLPVNNLITRRAALASTAAVGALALPAGAAVAAVPGDADPGLAAIEAGYARWQELMAQAAALEPLQDEASERGRALLPPDLDPRPQPPAEIRWLYEVPHAVLDSALDPTKPVTIPARVRRMVEQYRQDLDRWQARQPKRVTNPDLERAHELEAERHALWAEADEARREVLAIPTTSPRGVLVKLAIALEAKSLDRVEPPAPDNWSWAGEDLLPFLAADLRAMTA